ncbi:AraC family transcriptional regulator [Azorhizobium oxalatiphilum]|uniref:AraC family transcriptional regulator n=1 Tax=Azorhizobium oxalatiphilum TaxID=980631 RepID=A0A917C239_9HYPH|nr:AraC family transcriptional regulator [Azorhizobium oxalatiphilum]GGF68249.1 AraC family transcriptional regulator [Azorhizobium oxalatiphilum]
MDLHTHGTHKFPHAGIIASSLSREWRGVAAELRSHPTGEIPAITPAHMEITLATRTCPGGCVSRKGAGVRQRSAVHEGAIWLCPIGVGEDDISINAPLDEILHIYLPASRFEALAEDYGDPRVRGDAIRYLSDLRDPLIWQVGQSIRAELLQETSAGRMMVETASLALTARLVHAYGHDRPETAEAAREAACPERIARAMAFIRDNLERDVSVSEAAAVACLSPFHFARMFKRVTGKTPHGFLSEERLSLSRRLLADPEISLVTVAHRTGFSSQAAFSTAFKRVMRCSPGSYRRALIEP